MSDLRIGDICTLASPHWPGRWVFAGFKPDALPSNAIGLFLATSGHDTSITFGIHGATVEASPKFTPGQSVAYFDYERTTGDRC